MLTGQVGIVMGDSNVSFWPTIIRKVTHSQAFHVVIADSETTYIGAEPGGVRRRRLLDDDYDNIAWSDFDTIDNANLPYLRAELGKPYAYMDDFIVGIDQLTPGSLPTSWYDHLINRRTWQCAALGDWWLHINGIDLFPGKPVGAIFPGMFETPWTEAGWL